MPSYVYPAVFHPDTKEGGYLITFPDLPGCITEGKDLDEALYMAQDAKSIALEEGEFVNFIRVEVRDTSAVRRSVSIPKWLDEQAANAHLSLSRVLQDALRERLSED